jgi:hypothetical protein
MRVLFAIPLLVLTASLAACGKASPGAVDPQAPAYVEVQNQSFYDMTVYASRGGARIRLGMVSGNSTQVLQIPRTLVNPGVPIRFMADPVGGARTPYTEEIIINPGDTLVLRIPPG